MYLINNILYFRLKFRNCYESCNKNLILLFISVFIYKIINLYRILGGTYMKKSM